MSRVGAATTRNLIISGLRRNKTYNSTQFYSISGVRMESTTTTTTTTTTTQITSRQQYHSAGLEESDLLDDPMQVFKRWFEAAQESKEVTEPEAMCLSTGRPTGEVSSRYVLLKRFDAQGFIFFTNYHSRKAQELESNRHASLAFYWPAVHQQIRISGHAQRTSLAESQEYFDSRPLGSQIAAWSSPQSQPIGSRQELLDLVTLNEQQFKISPGSVDRSSPEPTDSEARIGLPPHWGGFRIIPHEIEFWVGRPNRLHDRFVYRRDLADPTKPSWTRQRLAP